MKYMGINSEEGGDLSAITLIQIGHEKIQKLKLHFTCFKKRMFNKVRPVDFKKIEKTLNETFSG